MQENPSRPNTRRWYKHPLIQALALLVAFFAVVGGLLALLNSYPGGNPLVRAGEAVKEQLAPPQPRNTDPLSCYIAADGSSMTPTAVQLRCGSDAAVDYEITHEEDSSQIIVNEQHLRGWQTGSTSVGTSRYGSLIIRTQLTNGTTTFSYTRDLADGPESTDIQRSGTPWPADEIPTK